jgi:hypothetical protein
VEDVAVVRERPLGREAGLRPDLVRPEADQDDEDEWGDQVEGEPGEAGRSPGGGQPAAALRLRRLDLAQGALDGRALLEDLLGLLEPGNVELRCRLRP